MKANEVVRTVVSELSSYGITPKVINGGRHIHVKWKAGERERLFVTSTSPSDVRTKLNARAEVRRMLREDGIQQLVLPSRPIKVNGGGADLAPLIARIEKLESELASAIDLMLEIQTPVVQLVVNGRTMTAVAEPERLRAPRAGGASMAILETLDRPHSINEIVRAVGGKYQNIASMLTHLRKKGLVERLGRGQWVRKAL